MKGMETAVKCVSVENQLSLSLTDMRSETAIVTHVESPEKFFCRLASDENKFKELNEKICTRVGSPFAKTPDSNSMKISDQLLAYSSIHKTWCRSELLSMDKQKDVINCKLYLIDYGSVEIVVWHQIRETEDQIIDYNCGQSFCFECSLCYIKPYNEVNEWSSYANYLFEKLTKDKLITIRYQNCVDGVIICDLTSHLTGSAFGDGFFSMIEFLVHTRVARYKMGEYFYHRLHPEDNDDNNDENKRDYSQQNHDFEDGLNLIAYNPENRLFFN